MKDEIKRARLAAGKTLAEAAALVYVDPRTWRRWEAGDRKMPQAMLELFRIKTKSS